MAGQSFAMGEAFGKGFQYGKRRISAMTNEEFNAMSAKDHFEETTADISAMIPSMKSQMNNFSTLQTDIIKTLIEQLKDAGITIGEAIGSSATETFVQGPPGGTDLARSSLDQLRDIVGLPPLYSKLVSPAGIAALIKYWQDSNIISALKLSLNPTNWILNEIKKIFGITPSVSNVANVFNWIQSNLSSALQPPTPSDAPLPSQESSENVPIPEPSPNTLILDKDGNVISSGDVRPDEIALIRAPSSIETQWKKYMEEIRFLNSWLSKNFTGTQAADLRIVYLKRKDVVIRLVQELEAKYFSPSNLW